MADLFVRKKIHEAEALLVVLPEDLRACFRKTGSVDFTASLMVGTKFELGTDGKPRRVDLYGDDTKNGDRLVPVSTEERFFRINAARTENGREVIFIGRDIPLQKHPTLRLWGFSDLQRSANEAELSSQSESTLFISVPPLLLLADDIQQWELKPGLTIVFGATGSGKNHVADRLARGALLKQPDGHFLRYGNPVEGSLFPRLLTSPGKHDRYDCGELGAGLLESNRYDPADLTGLPSFVNDALRQKAGVVTISELREKPEFQQALTLATTGHRVVATGHATDLTAAMQRLFDVYECINPSDQRIPLVSALNAVIHVKQEKLAIEIPKDALDSLGLTSRTPKIKVALPTICQSNSRTESLLITQPANRIIPGAAGPGKRSPDIATAAEAYFRNIRTVYAMTVLSILLIDGLEKCDWLNVSDMDDAYLLKFIRQRWSKVFDRIALRANSCDNIGPFESYRQDKASSPESPSSIKLLLALRVFDELKARAVGDGVERRIPGPKKWSEVRIRAALTTASAILNSHEFVKTVLGGG